MRKRKMTRKSVIANEMESVSEHQQIRDMLQDYIMTTSGTIQVLRIAGKGIPPRKTVTQGSLSAG